nr:hypothetical protein [Tanacetum cinerariifolium]
MMKGSDFGIQEKKAKLFNEWERFTSNEGESIESYYHRFLKLMNDLKRNKHFHEKIASNLKFLNNLQPEWSRHVTIVHQTNDLHTADTLNSPHQDQSSFNQNYLQQSIPNPEDITDSTTAMNMTLALMAKAFKLNYSTPTNNNQRISSNPKNRQIAQPGQNAGNPAGYNDAIGNQNQIGNGNLVAARTEGNAARQNGNQTRCYNCRGEEARTHLQEEEYDLMAAAADLDEFEEVNANCILMANLQQASTSGTQTDSAPVNDTDRSAEVHEKCDDNEIFNMFTQEEQYTELLEPIPELHQVPQNDNDVISEDTSNLAIEVEKVNLVNRKLKEANADMTTELARYKNQERCFEISQEKYDKLERMTIETHNWASSAHQELHKIVRDEIFPIVNQVDARLQNFEIQFLKEAAKFVGDFKSLAKEVDDSLAKHKEFELKIKRLLKAVVNQDIVIIVQNESVVDTSDFQTKLERTKERFENCIIKKETEYAKLWNDWYKKCDECKYDKISYDNAYNDMQQKIKRLQAQLGDLKGKSKDTSSVSYTRNPLS